MADELHLHRSELFGLATILFHECGGLDLGSYSPTRILNRRTGRQFSAAQWYALLEPYYLPMIDPVACAMGTLPADSNPP